MDGVWTSHDDTVHTPQDCTMPPPYYGALFLRRSGGSGCARVLFMWGTARPGQAQTGARGGAGGPGLPPRGVSRVSCPIQACVIIIPLESRIEIEY